MLKHQNLYQRCPRFEVSLFLKGFATSKITKLSDWSGSFSESSGGYGHASTLPRMSSLSFNSGQSGLDVFSVIIVKICYNFSFSLFLLLFVMGLLVHSNSKMLVLWCRWKDPYWPEEPLWVWCPAPCPLTDQSHHWEPAQGQSGIFFYHYKKSPCEVLTIKMDLNDGRSCYLSIVLEI